MKFDLAWNGLYRVISGGQTGADQGGLLAAHRLNVETGGTAPAGYKVSGGYNELLAVLGLTASGDYVSRTKRNVADSDGTVIFTYDAQSRGSVVTLEACRAQNKPHLSIDITRAIAAVRLGREAGSDPLLDELMFYANRLYSFINENAIAVLNVAGNRELRPETNNGASRIITMIVESSVSAALEMLRVDGKLVERS